MALAPQQVCGLDHGPMVLSVLSLFVLCNNTCSAAPPMSRFPVLLQARMVLEEPSCVDSIIQDWERVLPATLKRWHVEQQDLQVFFEEFRNNLLQTKEVCTIACNRSGYAHSLPT